MANGGTGKLGARILIAEDEPNIVELLTFVLQRAGCEIRSVSDGEAAIAEIRRDPPDVLLLDLMLPRKDGYEVLKAVRGSATHAALPVVMLTAKGQEKDRKVAESLGVDVFITKPFSNQEVVDSVLKLART
ncbi:MAG: response regulator [Minwuia sp.]|nr:response regulator [Minwuia sp.]